MSACAVAVVVSDEEKMLLASEVLHPLSYIHSLATCTAWLHAPLGYMHPCAARLGDALHPLITLQPLITRRPLTTLHPLPTLLASQVRASGREPVKVQVVANAHEPEPRTRTAFARRRGLVFVGNFNHLPNRDAVLHFATEVHPLATPLSYIP